MRIFQGVVRLTILYLQRGTILIIIVFIANNGICDASTISIFSSMKIGLVTCHEHWSKWTETGGGNLIALVVILGREGAEGKIQDSIRRESLSTWHQDCVHASCLTH